MKTIKYKLQGHGKFPLREGWISKILHYDFENNPKIFSSSNTGEATDSFGIGSVMVQSLRYWCKTLGILADSDGCSYLTDFGKFIRKYDPYLERIVTIWLLHSRLVKNKEEATTWNLYFNKCNIENITRPQIKQFLAKEMEKEFQSEKFSLRALEADVDVLLNMYCSKEPSLYLRDSDDFYLIDPEDTNISPFSRLGLISSDFDGYRRNLISKQEVDVFLILNEIIKAVEDRPSISIDKLVNGNNGIASIYQLSELVIDEFLDELEARSYITVNRTAGLNVIYLKEAISEMEILAQCYSEEHI